MTSVVHITNWSNDCNDIVDERRNLSSRRTEYEQKNNAEYQDGLNLPIALHSLILLQHSRIAILAFYAHPR